MLNITWQSCQKNRHAWSREKEHWYALIKLEKLQRRAERIIMKSDRSETALKYLRSDTLKVWRERYVLSLVKKCINKK